MKVNMLHNGRFFQLLSEDGSKVLADHLSRIRVLSSYQGKPVACPFALYGASGFDGASLTLEVPSIRRRRKPCGDPAYIYVGGSLKELVLIDASLAPGQFEGPVLTRVTGLDGLPSILGHAKLLGVETEFLVKSWCHIWTPAKSLYDQAVDELKSVYPVQANLERLKKFTAAHQRLMDIHEELSGYSLDDFLADKPLRCEQF